MRFSKWPYDPHEGPWATPTEVAAWVDWRRSRAVLDARPPREYVIDGQTMLIDTDFADAIDEALFGPMTRSRTGILGDGFADWLYFTWPRRDGRPRNQYPIGGDPRLPESEPAVLVWKHHDQSRDIVSTGPNQPDDPFEAALGILEGVHVPYRLE